MLMNSKIKKKWVAALRSGKYIQGRGWLRKKNNTFCCLGVLCNLHAQTHPGIAAKQTNPNYYLGHSMMLPNKVEQWARLDGHSELEIGGIVAEISLHNDNGCTFAEIADAIESQL